MKIINISEDEKFIDSVIEQLKDYDAYFYIITKNSNLKFIKTKSSKIVIFNDLNQLIKCVNESDCNYVLLHSFYFGILKTLAKINKPILACSWGYDIYTEHYDSFEKAISINLYKPLTNQLINKSLNKIKMILKYIKDTFIEHCSYNYNKVLNNIIYLSTIIPPEFELIKQKYPHIKQFTFKYINFNDINKHFIPNKTINNNILIGNSRNMWNNHLDILQQLEDNKIKCNAYIPISYPIFGNDRDNYITHLKNSVRQYKYVNCIFIENYMNREDYFKLIDSCSIAIFGSLCQNGLGNIYQMFRTGKKVFFYKDSILYKYFKDNKLNIFSIDNDINQTMLNYTLDIEKQKENFDFVIKDEDYKKYINTLYTFLYNLNKNLC